MFGAVLPLSPYPNHAMIVLYITSTIFPYRHLITTPSSWLLQLPSSFYQFYSSLQFYGSLPQPCSLKTPSPSSPSSPSFSYSPAPRLWLSQYKFLLPLAYAYTFNDPLSIHFSLVPVLQVPTITSLAYFSTSPRLCLLSYSVITVYAFNPNYNLLQLLLLIPVYVVILLLVTLTHNFNYYYPTTTIKPLATQSSTSTYFSSSMSWSTIVLSPQPALQPPQSRILSMSQTSVSLAQRRHQFIIYVANPRLPGSKETPVHHLCRDPPSPWLKGDTRSSSMSWSSVSHPLLPRLCPSSCQGGQRKKAKFSDWTTITTTTADRE